MVRWMCLCVAMTVFTAYAASGVFAQDELKPSKKEDSLVGSWKLVSVKDPMGNATPLPKGLVTLKHFTPTSFVVVSYEDGGNITRTIGGTFKQSGEDYMETVDYTHEAAKPLRGKVNAFKGKLESNKWTQVVKLPDGRSVEEVWERVAER